MVFLFEVGVNLFQWFENKTESKAVILVNFPKCVRTQRVFLLQPLGLQVHLTRVSYCFAKLQIPILLMINFLLYEIELKLSLSI